MAKKKQKQSTKTVSKNGSVATVSGKGGYYSEKIVPALRKVIPDGSLATLGGKVGSVLAPLVSLNPYAASVGGSAGKALGSAVSRLLGFGDYTVVNNTLTTVGKALNPGVPVPSFGVMGEATRVRHREYIGDIVAPASPLVFNNTTYPINPGLAGTFPWLAVLANNYSQYIFNGLVFEFVSTSSDYAATSALGSIIMATDYDSVDSAYTDKIHMENAQYSISAKPSSCLIHTVECMPSATANKLFYSRSGTVASGNDLRFYDLGVFQLATVGLAAAAGTVLGELWASYDVSFYKPALGNLSGNAQHISPGGTINVSNAWGTAPTSVGALYFLPLSGGQMVCQVAGTYLISVAAACTTPTTPVWGGSGIVSQTILATVAPLASTTTFLQDTRVTCSAAGLVTVDISAWAANSGWQLRIAPYTTSYA